MDCLPAELPGKPKNIGMGSLSLLQWIFLTQELNQGFLHCRWILYQLSYQGSPGCHSTHLENSSNNNSTSPTHLPGLLWDHILSILSIHPSPCGSAGKESACNEGDLGWIPGLGRSPGGEHGNPLQYSCLENPRGQRSLLLSPWGLKESGMTERLSIVHYIR